MPAEEKFVADLITRADAQKIEPGRGIPPGATHKLKDDGSVKRVRFKLT